MDCETSSEDFTLSVEMSSVSTPFWPTVFLQENPRPKPGLLFITGQSEANVRSRSHEQQEKSWCQSDQRHVRVRFGDIPLKPGRLQSLTDAFSDRAPEARSTDE
ncbi:hypothetical protein CRG98_018731 [Punica granatum]|uniref:Uncharacterized protein n=1 Tax=Punica granatum TaxID=22663 RepID=A0A2I0JX09_PUNGR|nr:hypothetical protein CRG98_018731 [Punica granatum]